MENNTLLIKKINSQGFEGVNIEWAYGNKEKFASGTTFTAEISSNASNDDAKNFLLQLYGLEYFENMMTIE
jgi:hypothetical protein